VHIKPHPSIAAIVFLALIHTHASSQTEPVVSPLTTQEVVARVTPATIMIRGSDSLGSGVVLSDDGLIVTNAHVIADQTNLTVQFTNGDIYDGPVALVGHAPERDLALLQIDRSHLTPAILGTADVALGERVVVIGNPQGLRHTVSEGIISGRETTGEGLFGFPYDDFAFATGTELLQTDASVSMGSSGGGMFNANAELIGVVTFLLIDGQNLNFAVPVNYIRDLLGSRLSRTSTASRPPAVVRPPALVTGADQPLADTPMAQETPRGSSSIGMVFVFLPFLALLVAWWWKQQQLHQ